MSTTERGGWRDDTVQHQERLDQPQVPGEAAAAGRRRREEEDGAGGGGGGGGQDGGGGRGRQRGRRLQDQGRVSAQGGVSETLLLKVFSKPLFSSIIIFQISFFQSYFQNLIFKNLFSKSYFYHLISVALRRSISKRSLIN